MAEAQDRIDFIIAGTQKGGTTALWRFLAAHPQISFAARKELHFFSDETRDWSAMAAPGRLQDYHANFAEPSQGVVRGEATPKYMYHAPAMRRIWDYNPRIRLIFILRDPVLRAHSHYLMMRTNRPDVLGTFSETLLAERANMLRRAPHQYHGACIDRGFYAEQLRRVYRLFPAEQVLVLRNEDLLQDHDVVLARVFRFLHVDDCVRVSADFATENPGGERMERDVFNALCCIFINEIRQIELMLRWDCSAWIDGWSAYHGEPLERILDRSANPYVDQLAGSLS